MTGHESLKKSFTFRFYAELNDFLPDNRKQVSFIQSFKTPITVFDTLISLKIPVSEVDMVLVNGESVKLSHSLNENDYILVYPVFESLDISSNSVIREKPIRISKFILDCHLGKLARYLRMLGFDTCYENYLEDKKIINIAKEEGRIILTRDKLLLRSKEVYRGYYVRSIDKDEQINEIVKKFDLYSQFKPFSRCMVCNCPIEIVDNEIAKDLVSDDILQVFDQIYYCKNCDKPYWKGTHYERMKKFIEDLSLKLKDIN